MTKLLLDVLRGHPLVDQQRGARVAQVMEADAALVVERSAQGRREYQAGVFIVRAS